MKKLFIASAIAMTMAAGSAMAANQQAEVQFLGVVTNVTCDVNANVNGNTTNTVQLGTVSVGEPGQPVEFALKAADPTAPACQSLSDQQTATVVWQGPFIAEGLSNASGTAGDAKMTLETVNAKTTAVQQLNSAKTSVDFEANKITDGMKFKAALKGGNDVGTFVSAAAYAVSYK
ncbi:hypothetical protein XS28_22885 [Salmonella enterica subsp. enterica]|nr:hypothetical protein [Salmonella enterica subsp. enterica]EDV0655964.1 hypothetical protein [Salmonella enterica subsp. enterica]